MKSAGFKQPAVPVERSFSQEATLKRALLSRNLLMRDLLAVEQMRTCLEIERQRQFIQKGAPTNNLTMVVANGAKMEKGGEMVGRQRSSSGVELVVRKKAGKEKGLLEGSQAENRNVINIIP